MKDKRYWVTLTECFSGNERRVLVTASTRPKAIKKATELTSLWEFVTDVELVQYES